MTDITHNQRIVAQFTRWAKPFAELPIHAQASAMARSLAACALEPTLNVLDVACGPGILACAMAPHARQVTGIDITPAMIAPRPRCAGRRWGCTIWPGTSAMLPRCPSRRRVSTG